MKFIIGKKIGMTQVWRGDRVVAVTKVQAGPCVVVQVKSDERDGYSAAQLGYGKRKEKNIKKPQKGHMKGLGSFECLREFRLNGDIELERGDKIGVETFNEGDKVKVSGVSKGRGFQGVVKRHGFAGQIKTHGTKDQLRMPGSIGATGPAHVFKGVRMPGRMGGENVTVSNLEIIEVDKENNILLIKGALPGHRNGLVLIAGEGDLVVSKPSKDEDRSQDAKVADSGKQSSESKDEGSGEPAEGGPQEKQEKKEQENKTANQ